MFADALAQAEYVEQLVVKLCYFVGQCDKFVDGELFGASGQVFCTKKIGCVGLQSCFCGQLLEQRTQGATQHLTALIEGSLYHTFQQSFVATTIVAFVAGQSDHSALYLGWWIEHARFHGKEVLYIVP